MTKKFVLSVVGLFVVSMLLGFIVHGAILHGAYAKLPNLFRPDEQAQAYFGYMLLAHLFIAAGVTWVYRRGHEAGKPALAQGARFGLAMAVLISTPGYLIYFAVQPMPSDLVAQQIVLDAISWVIMGIAAAALNKT
jgi:hypothetical protein